MLWVNMNIITIYCLTNAEEMMPYLSTDLGLRPAWPFTSNRPLGKFLSFLTDLPASTSVFLLSIFLQQSQDANMFFEEAKAPFLSQGLCTCCSTTLPPIRASTANVRPANSISPTGKHTFGSVRFSDMQYCQMRR